MSFIRHGKIKLPKDQKVSTKTNKNQLNFIGIVIKKKKTKINK